MGVVLRAHPVRGESHIQRNAKGEVATLHKHQSFIRPRLQIPTFKNSLRPAEAIIVTFKNIIGQR